MVPGDHSPDHYQTSCRSTPETPHIQPPHPMSVTHNNHTKKKKTVLQQPTTTNPMLQPTISVTQPQKKKKKKKSPHNTYAVISTFQGEESEIWKTERKFERESEFPKWIWVIFVIDVVQQLNGRDPRVQDHSLNPPPLSSPEQNPKKTKQPR